MNEPIGVLVMAYGTASGPDDVERYYTDIRGGRAPSPEHLKELQGRYAAIGNRFPLLEITTAQAAAIEAELNREAGEGTFRSYLGMKHSPPFIDEGVARMWADGVTRAVGLVMAPHWSGMSVETYADRARASIEERDAGIEFTYVKHWHDHPGFVTFLGTRVRDALAKLPSDAERDGALVVFSAHSLPQRTVEDGTTRCTRCDLCPDGCTYERQLRETADLVAAELGLQSYTVGWQSAGRTADPWLGPPVEDVIRTAAKEGRAVVVCSAGFVADHLEVLYDLDIEAKEIAEAAGLRFERTEMPNVDRRFIAVLADVVGTHVEGPAGP